MDDGNAASDDDVVCTGAAGDDIARTAPHARFDCLVCPMASGSSNTCPTCFCWVCDVPARTCKSWAKHCDCDGSLEWAALRQKERKAREAADAAKAKEARAAAAGIPARSAAEVAAMFQRATEGGAATGGEQEEDQRQAEDEENEDLFAEYEPLHYDRGQPHPTDAVETTSLSFADAPPISYELSLPPSLLKPKTPANPLGGALSRLQLETVAYACQRHEAFLPSGERAGFFLGDGVGLGKGRQLAGLLLENHRRGRRRHVWLSVSADLAEDARRDLGDIGAGGEACPSTRPMPQCPVPNVPCPMPNA